MGMFDKYGNDSYTAYNLTPPSVSRGVLTNFKTPLYTRNKQGNIDRFFWVEGEHFNLELKSTTKVRIPKGSIVFNQSGESPNSSTKGEVGTKCYNVEDYTSWTLESINDSQDGKETFSWKKDDLFECLEDGGEEIELTLSVMGSSFIVRILNFRREVMYEYTSDDNLVIIPVNEEETADLKQGQYFLDLFIERDGNIYFIDEYGISILGDVDRLKESIITRNYYVDLKTIQSEGFEYEWYPIEGFIPLNITLDSKVSNKVV